MDMNKEKLKEIAKNPHMRRVSIYAKAKQTRANIRKLEADILALMAHPGATVESIMNAKSMYERVTVAWQDIVAKMAERGIIWREPS